MFLLIFLMICKLLDLEIYLVLFFSCYWVLLLRWLFQTCLFSLSILVMGPWYISNIWNIQFQLIGIQFYFFIFYFLFFCIFIGWWKILVKTRIPWLIVPQRLVWSLIRSRQLGCFGKIMENKWGLVFESITQIKVR